MSRQRNVAPDEVFLSHSSKDVRFTRRLRSVLATHGVGAFLSKEHIRGAQEWHDEIGEALKRCDWFLIVLSPHSARSKWVKHELIYALQANRYRGRIIPILYKTCDPDKLSWTLSAFQWIDFRKDFQGGCRQLLHIWKLAYAPQPKIPKARR